MKRITFRTIFPLALLALGLFGTAHAQTLSNGSKSLKKLKQPVAAPTTEAATTGDTVGTTDPKDRVQWGDKRDPIVTEPIIGLSTSTTTVAPGSATHRSRSQSVPEPTTLGLLALGGLVLRRRRKH